MMRKLLKIVGKLHKIVKLGEEYRWTELGRMYNHSEEPNCERKQHNNKWFLKTIQDIDKNIELTLKYSMYKP